tara:strand:- start:4 stop:177 length:174 start_codon:yes stop_codon:yes gene_type:complete
MSFENPKYVKGKDDKIVAVSAVVNGKNICMPKSVGNRYYDALLKWVKIDGNTIEDAD